MNGWMNGWIAVSLCDGSVLALVSVQSDSVIFHIHGGGFVAQTSQSHEVPNRQSISVAPTFMCIRITLPLFVWFRST